MEELNKLKLSESVFTPEEIEEIDMVQDKNSIILRIMTEGDQNDIDNALAYFELKDVILALAPYIDQLPHEVTEYLQKFLTNKKMEDDAVKYFLFSHKFKQNHNIKKKASKKNPDKFYNDIIDRIKRLRTSLDITQERMADSLGISRYTYLNYEKGQSKFDVILFFKISKMLKTTPEQLFYGIDTSLLEILKANDKLKLQNQFLHYYIINMERKGKEE